MEALCTHHPPQQFKQKTIFMNSVFISKLKPKTLSFFVTSSSNFKLLSTTAHSPTQSSIITTTIDDNIVTQPKKSRVSSKRDKIKVTVADAAVYKEKWLDSLSYPLPQIEEEEDPCLNNTGSGWVLGIDPDTSGALAVLRPDESGCSCSPQVFDSPYLRLLVGKNVRKRLDAKSTLQLIRSLDAPIGTAAYIEQSIPFPKDGKQGWWSGGFNYGLWIGILVSSGFRVIPVPSITWKNEFKLSGKNSTKDDNRRLASVLFPSLDSELKRKKDHGRAEALLIAAYGKGLKLPSQYQSISANINTLDMDI